MKKPAAQMDLFTPAKGAPLPLWTATLGGRTVPYTLKRSSRAKQVWLRIGIGTGLEVVAPEKMSLSHLNKVLAKKADWIEKNLAHKGKAIGSAERPALQGGVQLPYLGEPRLLRVRRGRAGGSGVRFVSGEIVASLPSEEPGLLMKTLAGWYRKMAQKVISERVAKLSDGRRVGRVYIRNQRTRWGSCSPLGNLSFNWRLVMAPRPVIDYMVIHELTHLEHPNHSKRFWEKVSKRCPRYKEYEAWLKENGRALPL